MSVVEGLSGVVDVRFKIGAGNGIDVEGLLAAPGDWKR
jgi:hypothetical protein